MAIKYLNSTWRAHLDTGFPQDHRCYLDFRQKRYPSVAGSPTFTTVPSDLEIFPLTEAGCASSRRGPSATPVVVEEPALIGSTANPRVKWAGRGAIGVWKATTNLMSAYLPEDWSTGVTKSNCTSVAEYVAALGRSCAKVTLTAANGYLYKNPGATVVNGQVYTYSALVYVTAAVGTLSISFYDGTHQTVANFEASVGLNYIYVTATADAHTTIYPLIQLIEASGSFYILNSQIELGAYPTPFTPTTRAAGSLDYTHTPSNIGAVECWVRPYTVYNAAPYAFILAWRTSAASFPQVYMYYNYAGQQFYGGVQVSAGGFKQCYSTNPLTAGQYNTWIHLKLVWNCVADTVDLYQNGVLQTGRSDGTSIAAASGFSSNLHIGTTPENSTYIFDGLITDLAIWNTADTSTTHYDTATAYTVADLAALNRSGSHDFTGGYTKSLLALPTTFTFETLFKATCGYDTATDQYLASWYNDATHYAALYYNKTDDKFRFEWKDGTNARYLETAAFTTTTALNSWRTLSGTIDLSVATSSGSVLYLDRATSDTAWSGDIDVKASAFPSVVFRAQTTTASEFAINYFRIIPGYKATATEIANNLKGILYEEVYWPFNGHATGRTRCNVTSRVNRLQLERSIASFAGNSNANMAGLSIMSPAGQFADDQYAAWAPQNELYNGTSGASGTSAQKYLQNRVPIEVETWYGNAFEPEFVGRVDDDCFKRRSGIGMLSTVQISCYDGVEDFRRRVRQKAYTYEDYELCNVTTTGTSILHAVANMEAQKEWYNFLANSSFENTTAANSWTVAGGGATITRAAGGLLGSYQLDFLCATNATCTQDVSFTGRKRLNTGENWNYSIYAKAATAGTLTLQINELNSGSSVVGTVSTSLTLTSSWQKMERTCVISTSATATLRCILSSASAYTANLDCAMLIQRDAALDWFVLNDNDGAAGVESADDADSQAYQDIGLDVDDAMVVHPWVFMEQGFRVWDVLGEIASATGARYLGMDAAGTLKYRGIFKTGYRDPEPLFSTTSLQSIESKITLAQANKILINGIKIQKDTRNRMLWDAVSCGAFTQAESGDAISETIAANGYWPDPTIYGDFYAYYDEHAKHKAPLMRTDWQGYIWTQPFTSGLEGKAPSNSRVIGVKDPYLTLRTVNAGASSANWTDSTDFALRPDAALVYMRNTTGVADTVVQVAIRGKPIRALSGSEGWVHDSYVDYESIARNGERTQERANDFIVTKAQVEKLANYDWKYNKTHKHMYTGSDIGFRSYYEPGEWYELVIGAAGEEEYINSTVECYSVRAGLDADGRMQTSVVFRELEEGFKVDSGAYARLIASGPYRVRDKRPFVVVASQYFTGYADYYCDGTDDQVEWNAAFASGSREVIGTRGMFNITSSLTPVSNIKIRGEGESTIFNACATNLKVFYVVGSSTVSIENVSISDIKIRSDYWRTETGTYIWFGKNVIVEKVRFDHVQTAVAVYRSDSVKIKDNFLDGLLSTSITIITGIYLSCDAGLGRYSVIGNTMQDVIASDFGGVVVSSEGMSLECYIENNYFINMDGTTGNNISRGIQVYGDNIVIRGNRLRDLKNTVTASHITAIDVVTANKTQVYGNYCFDNGTATNIANTANCHYNDAGTSTMTNINSWQ